MLPVCGCERQDFHGVAGGGEDVAGEEVGSGGGFDEANAFALEDFAESFGDHAAVPRAPVEGDHAALRATAGFGLGHLVQHFVGGGVVHLAGATEASGVAGEEGDEAKFVGGGGGEEIAEAVDFRAVNEVELLLGLLLDELVGEHARAVDEAANGAVRGADFGERGGDGGGIADIERGVVGECAGGANLGEMRADFALGGDFAELGFEALGRAVAVGVGEEGFLDVGFAREAGEPVRLGIGERAATEQEEARLVAAGEFEDGGGGDAARAAGDDDEVAALEGGGRVVERGGGLDFKAVTLAAEKADFDGADAEDFLGDLRGEFGAAGCAGVEVEGFAVNLGPLVVRGLDETGEAAADDIGGGAHDAEAEEAVEAGEGDECAGSAATGGAEGGRGDLDEAEGGFQESVAGVGSGPEQDERGGQRGVAVGKEFGGRAATDGEAALLKVLCERGGESGVVVGEPDEGAGGEGDVRARVGGREGRGAEDLARQ